MAKGDHWHNQSRLKVCITCKQEKPLSDYYKYKYTTMQGNQSFRYESRCKVCNRQRRKDDWKNPVKRERSKENNKKWLTENKEKRVLYSKIRQMDDGVKAMKAAHQRARKGKIRAGLSSLDREERIKVLNIYKEAKRIEMETGIKHHVDHIIPLKHGGKHHSSNLQIITAEENLKKGASLSSLAITGGKNA